jgi:hypothetical protein
MFFSLFSLNETYSQAKKDKSECIINYVNTKALVVRSYPSADSLKVSELTIYQKVLIDSTNLGNDWVKIIYPVNGYVDKDMLFTEKEMDDFYFSKKAGTDLITNIYDGYTPYYDLLKNSNSTFYSDVKWTKDNANKVNIVNGDGLNLRKEANIKSAILRQFYTGELIVIDESYSDTSWRKVIYPANGYVAQEYIFTDSEVANMKADSIADMKQINSAVTESEIITYKNKNCDVKKFQKQKNEGNSEIDVIEYEKNYYVVLKNNQSLKNDEYEITVSDTADVNKNGYIGKENINIEVKTTDPEKEYIGEVYARESQDNNYEMIGKTKKITSEEPGLISIDENSNLTKGTYNFKTNIYDAENKSLLTTDIYQNGALTNQKIELPVEDDSLANGKAKFDISLFGTFAPYLIPVEQQFKQVPYYQFKDTIYPIGANLEFAYRPWNLSIGGGYNQFEAKSLSEAYSLQTRIYNGYIKYSPFYFFDDKMELFINAGFTKWSSNFQNIKYKDMVDYYPLETDEGFGYVVGAGFTFDFKYFIVGAQYQLYNSKIGTFGELPIDPLNEEEFALYIPKTQYKLFTGANQFQITLGYRFKFK